MGENRSDPAANRISGTGPLAGGQPITKLPAQDLDRARAFYRDKLGLVPVEEREGGLRYLCAAGEFHLFLSTGAASGEFTQMGFEVEEGIVKVTDNYPSKGAGERGIWFRDSERNLLALGQPVE
jgi:catechol 2,3-dioxygenase-like lactoylglutathione lyase family enzyme